MFALCALQAMSHPYLTFHKALLFWTQCKANPSSFSDSSLASQRGSQLLASQGIVASERKVGASLDSATSPETPKEEDGNYDFPSEEISGECVKPKGSRVILSAVFVEQLGRAGCCHPLYSQGSRQTVVRSTSPGIKNE